ncbi:MAG TPA: 50S ribosomal protein L29 [Polyangia bacterium]|jgi:large subunit ribosomal protein L29
MSAEHKDRPAELRERTDEELKAMLGSLEEDLFKFRVQRFTNQLENTMKIRNTRRTLARVKTLLTARDKGIEAARKETRPADEAKE